MAKKPGSDGAEALRAYLEQAEGAMRDLQEAHERIGRLAGHAVSADGLVKATADGRGGIAGVWFDPRAMRHDRETLGRTVAAVMREAQGEAARQARAIADEVLADALPEPPDESVIREQIEQVAHEIMEA